MLRYYKPIKCKRGFTYSVDNVRLKFSVNRSSYNLICDYFSRPSRIDVTHYESLRDFHYRDLYTIKYVDGESFTIGLSLNGHSSEQMSTCFVDFNPNKVCCNTSFWDDLQFLRYAVNVFTLLRVDVSIDLPFDRSRVFLRKDNRVYGLKQYSNSNKTEYLGVRNNVGRVKLYNKQSESKLDFPLTRVEVTIDSLDSWIKSVPTLFVLDDRQQTISTLNDTDFVLLTLLNDKFVTDSSDAVSLFNMLGRKKREKLAPLVLCKESSVEFDYLIVRDLLDMVKTDFMR